MWMRRSKACVFLKCHFLNILHLLVIHSYTAAAAAAASLCFAAGRCPLVDMSRQASESYRT